MFLKDFTHYKADILPEVDPAAQRNLRTAVRKEIKDRKGKGKGKGKGNKKDSPQVKKGKIAAASAASSGSTNHDAVRPRGKGGRPKANAGKGKGTKCTSSSPATPKNGKQKGSQSKEAVEHAERELGCPTCRFSRKGCHICKRPNYRPRGPNKRNRKA